MRDSETCRLPIAFDQDPSRIVVWQNARPVTWGRFVDQACALARTLPVATAVFNLCEDRYHFMLAFAASMIRGQTMLLPPSRNPLDIARVAVGFPDAYSLVDRPGDPPDALRWHIVDADLPSPPLERPLFADPPDDQPVAVLFTSGSTGTPSASTKSWQALSRGARLGLARFGLDGQTVVATVPAQHMFGLETSVMYPLLGTVAVQAGRPFYPDDLRAALAAARAPRVLLTTPVHLRACVAADLDWPPVEQIISATAPLPAEVAASAERAFSARVREIYGSTETGAIASRDTVRDDHWQLFDHMSLSPEDGLARVTGPQLTGEVTLNDWVAPLGDGRFRLLGRSADLVNVAGKRASLADLNQRLLDIDGVEDGVIVMPRSDAGQPVERPVALVVAPRLEEGELRARLLAVMDAVFVPRPIYRVKALPRNDTGKLPRAAVLAEIERLRREPQTANPPSTGAGIGQRSS